jgi:erythromycin esterase-like protein
MVKQGAQPLPDISNPAFGKAFDSFGGARVVLIGDGSHGTSEFYRARAAITQRLIEEHGFNIVAVEADWPDAHAIDRYVRYRPSKKLEKIRVFDHFPRWMWRNTEVQDFVDWLRVHNSDKQLKDRASFVGLDTYSTGASSRAVIEYLEHTKPELAKVARERYGCLERWIEDPAKYGRHALMTGFATCEAAVVKMLKDILKNRLELASHPDDGEAYLDAEMNARVVQDSEKYYRAMYYRSESSWNIRDTHMFTVLQRLLKMKPGSKAVVWAHNSHCGDARATAMGEHREEVNIGQLCREHFSAPGEVAIIGCKTHGGTVAAADEWDEPEQIMDVIPSRPDSYERVMHDTGIPSFLLDMREGRQDPTLLRALTKPRLERFIGVCYKWETERWSHYQKAVLAKQFDACVWFDESQAVHAFETAQPKEAPALGETYPFGL